MPAGRPPKQFDAKDIKTVEGLAGIGATQEEIANILGCSITTVKKHLRKKDSEFASAYKKGAAAIRITLRRKQIDVAKSGNVSMLIWLGKNMLGQKDRELPDNEAESTPIIIHDCDSK